MSQVKQQQMEHLVSFQGSEIRKFIINTINNYVQLSELDPNALKQTITSIQNMLDLEANNVKDINGIVNANKNAITRTRQEILDTISDLSKTQDSNVKNKLSLLEVSINNMFLECNTNMDNKLSTLKKELLSSESLDTFALCNIFTKSLYAYDDFICIATRKVGSGVNLLRLKVSGDHFNPKAAAYDTYKGNPIIVVKINNNVVYEAKVESVKIYNQFEYIDINTSEEIKTFEISFKQDAWEGGTDVNMDGLSEDRNLYVFDIIKNSVPIDKKEIKYKVGTVLKDYQEVMPWQGSLIYNVDGITVSL